MGDFAERAVESVKNLKRFIPYVSGSNGNGATPAVNPRPYRMRVVRRTPEEVDAKAQEESGYMPCFGSYRNDIFCGGCTLNERDECTTVTRSGDKPVAVMIYETLDGNPISMEYLNGERTFLGHWFHAKTHNLRQALGM